MRRKRCCLVVVSRCRLFAPIRYVRRRLSAFTHCKVRSRTKHNFYFNDTMMMASRRSLPSAPRFACVRFGMAVVFKAWLVVVVSLVVWYVVYSASGVVFLRTISPMLKCVYTALMQVLLYHGEMLDWPCIALSQPSDKLCRHQIGGLYEVHMAERGEAMNKK
ncbi:uncharacterized protein J3D65DRAFT_64834 [Phyllosticta citribraziliensis]|uniref:Transmembrane protein n=1 Tax=Phyllosticta citribraziliensis TaxID=989973 RepID=A0ABR1LCQ6_9PEZI